MNESNELNDEKHSKSLELDLSKSPNSVSTPKSPISDRTPKTSVHRTRSSSSSSSRRFNSRESTDSRVDNQLEVSKTVSQLALRSSSDYPKSKTGRHLRAFGENIKHKLKTSGGNSDKHKSSETKGNPESVVKPIWDFTSQLFSTKKSRPDDKDSVKSSKSPEIEINITDEAKNNANGKQTETKLSESNNKMFSEDIQMNNISDIERSEVMSTDRINSLDWHHLAVEVIDVNFSYKSNSGKILRDVNMSIPKSAIYGLLGPSGCGKTTLLKLVLGRIRQDSGSVKVNGKAPGNADNNIPGVGVGFMPQELALYEEFTINEALIYFGKIYGMNKLQIMTRITFLVDFLDLPEPERAIQSLSGGQKRRVSLSVALVHSPPLLILDEPTVGTDPLLRERIWEHLAVLSNDENITILITTHYIEEARRAHIVSLMRNGRLLVEHSPQFLLNYFLVENLEKVFLKVCRYEPTNDNYSIPENYVNTIHNQMEYTTSEPTLEDTLKSDMFTNNSKVNLIESETKIQMNKVYKSRPCERIMALLDKNRIRVLRNKPLLAFQLILPTICILLFCLCIGKQPEYLKISVYLPELENHTLPLSSKFIESINNQTILIVNSDSKEDAIQTVRDGSTFGALIFDVDFTESMKNRVKYYGFVKDSEIIKSTIEFYGDLSDLTITQTLTKELIESELRFQRYMIKDYFVSPNASTPLNPRVVDPIVHFVDPPIYGTLNPKFRDFMAPGIILAVCYILAVGLTALSFVIERKEGLMERTLVSGVKMFEILTAQIIIQIIILILQTTLVLIVTFLVFKIPNQGSYIYVILMVLMQGITGMSFGLVISSLCKDEQSAIMLSLGSFYPYMILSGIIWPLEGMPHWLRQFSYFVPQTLPILSMRNVMLKGWNLIHTYVWLGFVSTTIWTIVFLVIAGIIGTIKK